jgi:small GTP-binding protein
MYKQKNYDYLAKLILIGDSNVGKSSLLEKFVEGKYLSGFSTVGIDLKQKLVTVDSKIVKLNVVDTGGQERFHAICRSYYRNSMAVFLVYDKTDQKSFDNLDYWLNSIKHNCMDDVIIYLIGTKVDDLENIVISSIMGHNYAISNNMKFYELSSKTDCVDQPFDEMCRDIIIKKDTEYLTGKDSGVNPINLETKVENKIKCC